MATDDQQVLVTGQADAPAQFRIPGNGQIRPKSIFASFDGTAAGAAFLPALKVISDGGETVGIYPTDTSVAAGASADVSWFPHVGAAASSSVTTAEWFYAVRSTNLTMTAGTEDTIPWSSLTSSDSSLFSLGTNVHANDAVVVARQGVLLVSSYLIPTSIGTDFIVQILNSDLSWGTIGENTFTPEVLWNRQGLPSAVQRFGPRDISLTATASVPDKITARYRNYDAANRVLTGAQLGGFWWPTSTLIS